MKRGGLGGAVLLAALAVALLSLHRTRTPARAPSAPAASPPPAAVEAPVPPEPPLVPAPEESPEPGKPGARLVGRVTDEEDHPIAGAGILLEDEIVARTGEDGRYQVDGVEGRERLIGAIAVNHAPSDLRLVKPLTQPVFEIDFQLRRGGGTLALSIAGSKDAEVFIDPVFQVSQLAGGRRRVEVREQATVQGLVPEWNVLHVRARGRAPQTLLARLPPEGVVETHVSLGQGATVFGTVRTADGAPAPGARVDLIGWEWTPLGAVADAAGDYRMEHAPAVSVELRAADAAGGIASTLARLSEGEERRWDPVLEPSRSITGRVVDERGACVADALVGCRAVRALARYPETTAADGTFRFDGLEDIEYRIAVWPPGRRGPPPAEVTTHPGAPPLTIALPDAEGAIAGVVATRSGAPAAGATVRMWPSNRSIYEMRARAGADGASAWRRSRPAGTSSSFTSTASRRSSATGSR